MGSENANGLTAQLGGVGTVVEAGAAHEPAPAAQLFELPSGDGRGFLLKTAESKWELRSLEGPREGVARHEFLGVASLVKWLDAFTLHPRRAQVFVGGAASEPVVVARLDPADPDGDCVSCSCKSTPEFRAWAAAAAGRRLSQSDFFALVRAFGDTIVGDNQAAAILGILSTLRVVGSSSLEAEIAPNGRFVVRGARADVRIEKELPGEIVLRLQIFADVPKTYALRTLLDVQADPEGGLSVALSFPGLARVLDEARADLVEAIQEQLGDLWTVCVGAERTESAFKRFDVMRIGRVEA